MIGGVGKGSPFTMPDRVNCNDDSIDENVQNAHSNSHNKKIGMRESDKLFDNLRNAATPLKNPA